MQPADDTSTKELPQPLDPTLNPWLQHCQNWKLRMTSGDWSPTKDTAPSLDESISTTTSEHASPNCSQKSVAPEAKNEVN